MRGPAKILGVALLGLLIAPYGQASRTGSVYEDWEGGTPGFAAVGDITHVANIPYPGSNDGGTDIEFTTLTVTKLDGPGGATGNPVCKTRNAAGVCIEFETEPRDFAVVGRFEGGRGFVIDITNPNVPVKVGTLPCTMNQDDIQIMGHYVLQGHDIGTGSCTKPSGSLQSSVTTGIVSIADPRKPVFVAKLTESRGAHNHTIHPTQPILYISNSDFALASVVHIWDLSNPAAPVKVKDWPILPGQVASAPHDITFNASGTRAYVAAVAFSAILNTEDPKNPSLISVIANEGISISHQADPTPDGRYMLITDEVGGGSVPGASPGGPVHVYDISNEAVPVKIGAMEIDCVATSCDPLLAVHITTSHVLRINPDGYTLAIGWYDDGVAVMDFSDMRGLAAGGSGALTGLSVRTIGAIKMPNAHTWSAKMWMEKHPGYVFANDVNRGFDVFKVDSMAKPGWVSTGTLRAGNPGTKSGSSLSEATFSALCDGTGPNMGLDARAVPIPAAQADGTYKIEAVGTPPAGVTHDLDVRFYDASCARMAQGAMTGAEPNPKGTIPANAKFALIELAAGARTVFNAYITK